MLHNTIRRHAAARLLVGGALAGVLTLGTMALPADAASSGWESILGGHIKTRSAALRIANQAKAKGFRTYVQRISAGNFEAEIFNGGTRTQAARVCAKATRAGLPHCSIEQEFHGDGWS